MAGFRRMTPEFWFLFQKMRIHFFLRSKVEGQLTSQSKTKIKVTKSKTQSNLKFCLFRTTMSISDLSSSHFSINLHEVDLADDDLTDSEDEEDVLMHPLSSLRNYNITSRLQMNESVSLISHDRSDIKKGNERQKRLAQMRFQHQQSSARSLGSEMSMSEITMKSDNSDSKSIASSIRESLVSIFHKGKKPLTKWKRISEEEPTNLLDAVVAKDNSDASIVRLTSTFNDAKLTTDKAVMVSSAIKPTVDVPPRQPTRRSTKGAENRNKDNHRMTIRKTESRNSDVRPIGKRGESEHRHSSSLHRKVPGSSGRSLDQSYEKDFHRRAVRRTSSGSSTWSIDSDQHKVPCPKSLYHCTRSSHHPRYLQRSQSNGGNFSGEDVKKKDVVRRTRSGSSVQSINNRQTKEQRSKALRRTRSGSRDEKQLPSHPKHDHRRRCCSHDTSVESSVPTLRSDVNDRSHKKRSRRANVSEGRVSLSRSHSALRVVATTA